ncbi:MAG TPA: ATP-binding protein, partial [Sphingomicrobium sp.]|nr:ATP-binding protein [Sphingomicrobium sp.]
PATAPGELHALVHEPLGEPASPSRPEPEPVAAEALLETIERNQGPVPEDQRQQEPGPSGEDAAEDQEQSLSDILRDMAGEEGSSFQPISTLYQDYSVRCRMRRIAPLDLPAFRRRFAMAVAGIARPTEDRFAPIVGLAANVPDELLAPFLVLAKAALDNEPCPDDDMLARAYGTSSKGRIRRLVDHLERTGLIVVRTDFSGRRSIGIPDLGVTTAPMD